MNKTVKTIVAALALTAVSFATQAQSAFKKSDRILEGTVSYSKTTDVDASYSINSSVGYFMTSKFAIGVAGSFGKDGADKTTNVGVFGRCYFTDIKNCKLFSQASISSNTTEVAGTKTTSTSAGLGFGANYFVTNKLALTMNVADLVSYTNVSSKSTLTVGFDGVNNPFSTAKFGVLYKF